MEVKSVLETIQKGIVKHAPDILAVLGGLGVVGTVALAIDGTHKVQKDLKEAGNDISNPDKIAIYAKAYAPTVCMFVATELCIYGSNKINKKRLATLAGAYILSESNFKEYKEKVADILGEKKFSDFNTKRVQKEIDENPKTEQNTCVTNLPNATQLGLWYDLTSKRYFYSNAEYIRRAEISATAVLKKKGWVSVNYIYNKLGIDTIPLGQDTGFVYDPEQDNEVVIQMDTALMGPDIPVGTIYMDTVPSSTWFDTP